MYKPQILVVDDSPEIRLSAAFILEDQGFEVLEAENHHYAQSILANNSVDLIYASHVLEYFDRNEVKNVLGEWYRVLKKGGLLRVAVPDFEAIVKVYLKYSDLDHRGILGPLYGKWEGKN